MDFGLTKTARGVKINIYCYEQNLLMRALLDKQTTDYTASLQHTAAAFKAYGESQPDRA